MKIALLIASAETGGLLRVTEALAGQLREDGHEVTVISITGGTPSNPSAPRTWEFESLGSDRVAASVLRLRRISHSRFDVIVVSQFHVGVMLAIARSRRSTTAIVWVEHSSVDLWRGSPSTKDRLAERVARAVCGRVEVMAAVSAATTEAINRDYRRLRRPAITLSNPVLRGTEPCFMTDAPGGSVRRDILFVGRLSPEKRVDLLLEAFAMLRERIDANLVIIGDGPERAALHRLADRLGLTDRVEFRGFHPDPPEVMDNFSTLVLCSDYEGLPTVLIEGLAHGCEIVAADCPTGPSEVLDGGRFGRLVPVGEADRLAAAIEESIKEPLRNQIDRIELAHHLRRFTVAAATASYETALCAAVESRRRAG